MDLWKDPVNCQKKTFFPPGPGMPSLTNDASCHLFVIPDLKHECLPYPAQKHPLVLGGEGITEGGDGGVGKPGEELGCPLYGHLLGWALTNSDSLPNAFFHCLFLHLWNHRSKSASLPARPVPFYFSLLPHRLRAPCLVVQYLFTLWS